MIRAPVGGGVGAGPFHSQNVESWFTSVAGLKVVAPATPADAKGLLLASVEDGNPVLYLEHKFLYRSSKEQVPAGLIAFRWGSDGWPAPGRDATVVTYGVGVLWALEAATRLAVKGREIEVVDLRTLMPWDREMVLGSARKTGRVLVLHEAPVTGGFGGELAAVIGQRRIRVPGRPRRAAGRARHPDPVQQGAGADLLPQRPPRPGARGPAGLLMTRRWKPHRISRRRVLQSATLAAGGLGLKALGLGPTAEAAQAATPPLGGRERDRHALRAPRRSCAWASSATAGAGPSLLHDLLGIPGVDGERRVRPREGAGRERAGRGREGRAEAARRLLGGRDATSRTSCAATTSTSSTSPRPGSGTCPWRWRRWRRATTPSSRSRRPPPLEDCWRLVDTSERTRRHCVMLENCCYGEQRAAWCSAWCGPGCLAS